MPKVEAPQIQDAELPAPVAAIGAGDRLGDINTYQRVTERVAGRGDHDELSLLRQGLTNRIKEGHMAAMLHEDTSLSQMAVMADITKNHNKARHLSGSSQKG
jgi:hypothetical protein